MNTIGQRLKEERERLGMNQESFAMAGGVKKRAQVYYEQDERCPDGHYFSALAGIGVDVTYILTGIRALPLIQAQPTPPTLPEPTPEDPLARRKAAVKMMMEQLVDQIDDPQGLDEIQVDLQKIKRTQDLEKEVAELRRKAG